MRLLSFEWDNLFSLGKGKITFNQNELLLITGYSKDEGSSNGSGKSSFANKGIIWTNYGQTPHGLKADDVVNRHSGKKKTMGRNVVQAEDGNIYTITRTRNPNKVKLELNGEDISSRKSSETQEVIDHILGRDFHTFIQTEMFGQGRIMSYASLPPAGKKAVLEQILPIDMLDEWAEEAKENAKEVNETLINVDKEIAHAKGKLSSASIHLENQNKFEQDWEDTKRFKIQELKSKIDNEKDKHKLKFQRISEIELDLSKRKTYEKGWFAELQDEMAEKFTELEALHLEMDKTKRTEDSLYLTAIEASNKLRELKFGDTKICSHCSQTLPEDRIKEIQQKILEVDYTEKEAIRNKDAQKEKFKELAKQYETIRDSMGEIKTKIQDGYIEVNAYNEQLQKLGLLKSEVGDNIPTFNKEIQRIQEEINPYIGSVQTAKEELYNVKQELNKVEHKKTLIENELESLNYWQHAYGKDMKLKLFQVACPFLEERTQYHLEKLRNPQINVQFSTVQVLASGDTKEDFNVRVWSNTGGEGFESLSGGEQQITSFAIGRALADLARSQTSGVSHFQILDEPFSMLDERNAESVVDYLLDEQKDGVTLLISNEETLKGMVPNRIHVVKEKGITNVQRS